MHKVIHKNKTQHRRALFRSDGRRPMAGNFSSSPATSFSLSHDVAVPQHTMFNRVAAASAVALMVLTGIATLGGNVKKQEAYADTTSARSSAVSVTSLPSIEVTLRGNDNNSSDVALAIKPTADGQFGRTSLDVNVSTNNTAGYALTMQSRGDTLKQTLGGEEYKIESLSSNVTCGTESDTECAEFPKNKWGYRVNGVDNDYSSVASTIEEPRMINQTDKAGDSSVTKIYFGSKIDNMTPTGIYSGVELTFTATTKVVTYSITYQKGNSKVTDEVAGLPERPQSDKLNAEGTTDVTLYDGRPTRENYTFTGWCPVEPTTNDATLEDSCNGGTTYQPGGTLTLDPTQSSNVVLYAMWSVTKPAIVFNFDTGISKVTVTGKFGEATNTTRDVATTGNSLNLMAGQEYTITPDYKTGYSKADTDDIKITTGGGDLSGYNYTPNAGGATIALASKANTYRITTGTATGISSVLLNGQNCSSGCDLTFGQTYSLVATEEGGYTFSNWSVSGAGSVAGNTTKSTTFTVGAGIATITPSAEQKSYSVTIKPGISGLTVSLTGSGLGGTTSCSDVNGCTVTGLKYGTNYNLGVTEGSGVAFDNWTKVNGTIANTSNKSTTYAVNVNQETTNGDTITAVGHTTTLVLQNVTKNTCPATATNASDTRDETVYQIQKLSDGNCWMLENLRLGATTLRQTLSTSNTNMSSSTTFSLPTSDSSKFTSSYYTSAQILTDYATTQSTGGDYQGPRGVYYNYCAASAGTICAASGSNNDDASYDICPAGWHMPSRDEINSLISAYSSDASTIATTLRVPFSGYFSNGSFNYLGERGYFWSATRYNGNYMCYFRLYGSTVDASNYYRYSGYPVRCMRSS